MTRCYIHGEYIVNGWMTGRRPPARRKTAPVAELVQTLHLLAVQRRLEGEIQLGEPVDGRRRLERIAAWGGRLLRSWI